MCSARSAHSKLEGTTNRWKSLESDVSVDKVLTSEHRLLRAAHEAEKPESNQHEAIVDALCEEHLQAAARCIRSKEILQHLVEDIREECRDLSLFLEAAHVGIPPASVVVDAGLIGSARKSERSALDRKTRSSAKARN